MVVFPPFGVGEEDGLRLENGDVNERHNWSMEWLLRTLGEGLHIFSLVSISSLSLLL